MPKQILKPPAGRLGAWRRRITRNLVQSIDEQNNTAAGDPIVYRFPGALGKQVIFGQVAAGCFRKRLTRQFASTSARIGIGITTFSTIALGSANDSSATCAKRWVSVRTSHDLPIPGSARTTQSLVRSYDTVPRLWRLIGPVITLSGKSVYPFQVQIFACTIHACLRGRKLIIIWRPRTLPSNRTVRAICVRSAPGGR